MGATLPTQESHGDTANLKKELQLGKVCTADNLGTKIVKTRSMKLCFYQKGGGIHSLLKRMNSQTKPNGKKGHNINKGLEVHEILLILLYFSTVRDHQCSDFEYNNCGFSVLYHDVFTVQEGQFGHNTERAQFDSKTQS